MYQKSVRVLLSVLTVYALLCATHLGEFWPFSIYPMFSTAGRPWTRALVREVPPDPPDSLSWQATSMEALPGKAFAVLPNGLFQNDLANYVSKTEIWHAERVHGLRAMFADVLLPDRNLLVMSVHGRLDGRSAVTVTATPVMLFAPDSTYLHPDLPTK